MARQLPTTYTGVDADEGILAAGCVNNPLPRSQNVAYADNPLLWSAGVFDHEPKWLDVKVSEVRVTQDYVIPKRVAQYLLPDDERPEDTKKLTEIIRVGDELVTINGTHRLVAYWLKYETYIHVVERGRWKKTDGEWQAEKALPPVKVLDHIRQRWQLETALAEALRHA